MDNVLDNPALLAYEYFKYRGLIYAINSYKR